MANIDKIRVKGIDYTIVDTKAQADIEEINGNLENYVTGEQMSAYTYDKATIDRKVQDSGTFDPTQYYNKNEIDGKVGELNTSIGAVDNKADNLAKDLENYFNGVDYNTGTKEIEFKNGETVKARLSAAPFIKDGMVENVEIEDGKLVITFNTDSGKEAIELELTDIFNAENYYSKTEADGKFGTLTEQQSLRSDVVDALGEIASLESNLQGKQDKLDGSYIYELGTEYKNFIEVKTKTFNGTTSTDKLFVKTINGQKVVGEQGDIELPTTDQVNAKLDKSEFETYTGETDTTIVQIQTNLSNKVGAEVQGTTLVLA